LPSKIGLQQLRRELVLVAELDVQRLEVRPLRRLQIDASEPLSEAAGDDAEAPSASADRFAELHRAGAQRE